MDDLSRRVAALREFGSAGKPDTLTRARVLGSLHQAQARRRRWWVAVPALALLFGSTAYAAAGGEMPRFVKAGLVILGVSEAEEPAPLPAPPATSRSARDSFTGTRAPKEAASQVTPEESPELAPAAPPATASSALTAAPARVASKAPAEASETSDAKPLSFDEADTIYKQAHRLHFHGGDRRFALAGYERYLREHPAGRFSVDAQYNRALLLVELGRVGEAMPTLKRFAQGDFGGYRRGDAERLLQALGERGEDQGAHDKPVPDAGAGAPAQP